MEWKGMPWLASLGVVLLYGVYLFATGHQLLVNDFLGHVWMALEERERGLGSSTNTVIPAGYPILLNFLHAFGLRYMDAGRVMTLIAAVPFLFFVWRGASRWGEVPLAGLVAWLLMATSYQFILTIATPLPDLIALSMASPLIALAFRRDRSYGALIASAFFAGLACGIRYTFIQSVVPLAVLLLSFSHPIPWKKRAREALMIGGGLIAGMLPEIIFALRAGHIPFQNSSKYYLTLLVGETNFSLTGTQLRKMPSAIDYVIMHSGKILPAWGYEFISNVAVFVLVPAALWYAAEEIGARLGQGKIGARIRREYAAMLIFEAVLLIPISLRQPVPYYVKPLLLCITIMVAAAPIAKLMSSNKVLAGALAIALSAMSILQVRSAVHAINNDMRGPFNNIIAKELYDLGARDSAEVLNLAAPFELYWPYGDRSPLLYYTLKEPGWLSLTNTLGSKRPFIYKITKSRAENFGFLLTRRITPYVVEEYFPGFELVRNVGGVRIYRSVTSR
jgi:hypothetical protein